MESRLPRKFSVILYADVVGYSRQAAENKDTTHGQLKDAFSRVFKIVSAYNGRIANNTAGNAFLAVFESAADAACCAVEIKKAKRNTGIPTGAPMNSRWALTWGLNPLST